MNWSEEQKKVIETRGCNLLVSAAAGSGKTAVLVERIIGLITDPTDPVSLDELLVMTFTRAAAEEMRERVGRALSERIELDPKNSWLKLQRAILPRARIATIDSVCQNLIRQYYQELEIDPGFRAAEESELKLVRMDILEKMISEQHEEAGEDFLNLVDSLSGKGMDERVSVLIEKLSSFADSCEWPDRFLSKQEEVCLKEEAGELSGLPWYESVLEWIQESTKEYLPLLSRAEELCEEPGGPDPYLDGVRECISYARIITGCSTYEDLWDKVHKMRFSSLKRTNKTKHDPEMTAFVKAVRDSFKAFVADKLQGKFLLLKPEDLKLSAAGAARINRELIRLTRIFRERYAEKKREKNQVDFSDMEHLALQLLYEETEDGMRPNALADELAGQFKEIMIDEYQDSNGVQEALLAALSAERFGRPDIFMVGDVKQSIYRFRQAEPHLFIEKYQSYTEDGIHKRIELNRNFRSRAEVLSSVNDVFDCIMRKELGGVEYDEKARLYPGASYPDPEDCKTEFLVMDPGSGTDDDVDTEEAEYRMIAGRILRLCQAGPEEGFTVQDRQSGKPRRAQFRDIAILMRAAKGHAEKLVDILSEYGIPAYFQNSTGYFSAPEVEVMLALLSVIDNPRQDIPLDAVMRSPIGGFSDDELALIRASYEEACAAEAAVPGDFYEAVKFRAKEDEKTQGFLSRLDGWREIADVVPVHLLLEQLFTDTGYYDQTAAGPDGMIRRKNLDMLLESAESYGQLNYHGLFQFTRYIEQQKKYDTDHGEAGAVTENDNIVKVMTIHGSKGLEFPVVFLARMATTPKGNDREEGIVADRKIGLGGDYTDPENGIRYPGLKKAFIKEIYAREDQGEQLRLFYVAMTRAREKLILTAARAKASERCEDALNTASAFFAEQSTDEKLPVQLIRKYHNWMDWLLLAMAKNKESIELKILTPGEIKAEAERRTGNRNRCLKELLKDLETDSVGKDMMAEQEIILHTKYPHEAETRLKPKISVSEIKMRSFADDAPAGTLDMKDALDTRKEKEKEEVPETAAADYDDAAAAAESYYEELWQRKRAPVSKGALRGTAFHRALELLSYQGSADEMLSGLSAGGRMDKESLELLDKEAVRIFLASSLGVRMAKAASEGKLHREQHFMIGRPAFELDPDTESHELQLLQGIIDAYIEEEDSITLIDYKTDYAFDESVLIGHYRTQLELYAGALEQLTGKKVTEKIIYSTHLKKEILM